MPCKKSKMLSPHFRITKLNQTGNTTGKKQRNLRKVISSNEAKVNKDLFRQLSTDKDRWKFINEQRNSARPSVSIDSLRNSFGDILTGPMQIAELFNYKFSKLGEYLGRSRSTTPNFREPEHEHNFNCFGFRSFAVREVTDELLRLRKDTPRGPSPIPPWALIESAHIVAPVLTLIFNNAIMQCKFIFISTRIFYSSFNKPFQRGDIFN